MGDHFRSQYVEVSRGEAFSKAEDAPQKGRDKFATDPVSDPNPRTALVLALSDAVRAAALTGDARLLMVATGALSALVAGEEPNAGGNVLQLGRS